VACKIDSRTILDQPGAETLLGNGDMLFSDRGTKLRTYQGAFLSDDEIHRVVEVLKKQGKPVYDMNSSPSVPRTARMGPRRARNSPMRSTTRPWPSYATPARPACLHPARLQIGYNRSARMVEQMERTGSLVGQRHQASRGVGSARRVLLLLTDEAFGFHHREGHRVGVRRRGMRERPQLLRTVVK